MSSYLCTHCSFSLSSSEHSTVPAAAAARGFIDDIDDDDVDVLCVTQYPLSFHEGSTHLPFTLLLLDIAIRRVCWLVH